MLSLLLVPAFSLGIAQLTGVSPLLFETFRQPNGGTVLIMRDCGLGHIEAENSCQEWQKSFSRGDAARLESFLARTRFAEIWLYSGGGNLDEGIKIGRLLRQVGATVRVPNAARMRQSTGRPTPTSEVICASSCTVAFMGGVFRYMDPEASYLVHSASIVLGGIDQQIEGMVRGHQFRALANDRYVSERLLAMRLLAHFQNALLFLARRPPVAENDFAFQMWAQRASEQASYEAADSVRDSRRVDAEGMAAAQDIVMRLERESMRHAIEDLRAELPRLGARAAPALRMVEAMYDTSIKETQSLSRETMLQMGYLTQEIDPGPAK